MSSRVSLSGTIDEDNVADPDYALRERRWLVAAMGTGGPEGTADMENQSEWVDVRLE